MNLDFTVDKFYQLCKTVIDNYPTLTFEDYLFLNENNKIDENNENRFIIFRHDIDRKPRSALNTAKIENELGIRSTYYFRMNKNVFNPEIMGMIKDMNHEIGYHYEVLGKTKGNYEKAIELFEYELKEFRKICDVKTICMHGNPLSKYDSRDLWKVYDFKKYGIVGEAYISIVEDIIYFSDTGRSWNLKNNLRDFIPNKKQDSRLLQDIVGTTNDMIKLIKTKRIDKLYISTHPERWSSNNIEWFFDYMKDLTFNAGKKVIIMTRKYDNIF